MKHYGLIVAEGTNITNTVVASGTSDPTNPDEGELFFRTDTNKLRLYAGGAWTDMVAGTAGISAVVEDTDPHLGGDLDLNSNVLTDSSSIGFKIGATQSLVLTASNITLSNSVDFIFGNGSQIQTSFGSVSVPAISIGQTDTGFYQTLTDSIVFTQGGTPTWLFKSNGTITSQVIDYETLVIADDIIPNKKYVDDAITTANVPAGNNQEIQFNDNGAFGSTSSLQWASFPGFLTIGNMRLTGGIGGTVSVASGGNGRDLTLTAEIKSTVGGTGGNVVVGAGDGTDTSAGGGAVDIDAGDGGETSDGGNVDIDAGQGGSTSGDGGNVVVTPGAATVAGTSGYVMVRSPNGVDFAEFRITETTVSVTPKYIALRVPDAIGVSRTWTLPEDDPSVASGKFLTTDASGVLSFDTPPAGISAVVEDTDPHLGGHLDVNGKQIKNSINSGLSIKGYQTSGVGGQVDISGGFSTGSTGGVATIRGGDGTTGGNAQLKGGQGATSAGGSVIVNAGNGPTSGGSLFLRIGIDSTDGNNDGIVAIQKLLGTSAPELHFYEASTNGINTIALRSPDSVSADATYTLPELPTGSPLPTYLKTNASGILSWANGADGLTEVVEDLSPELGGDLDVNGKALTHASATPLKVVAESGVSTLQLGSSTPLYVLSSTPSVGFNSYWDGSNWVYGEGSSSHYAGMFELQPSTGALTYSTTAATGDDGDTAILSTRLFIDDDVVLSAADNTTGGTVFLKGGDASSSSTGGSIEIIPGMGTSWSGGIHLKSPGSNIGVGLYLYEGLDNGTNSIRFRAAGNIATSWILTLPDAAPTSNGMVLVGTTGGALSWVANSWFIKTANYTASSGDLIVAVANSAFTITLPPSPSVGDAVRVKVSKDTVTNNITVGRNGKPIDSSASNFIINTLHVDMTFVYVDATIGWAI